MVTKILLDAAIGFGIFLLLAPIVFGVLAVAISILQGVVLLIGSLVVSARHRRWQTWEAEWTIPDWFGDGF